MAGNTQTPAGWRVVRLGEVATLQRGVDLPIQDRVPGSVPVYGSNGILGTHVQTLHPGPGVITGRSGSIGVVYFSTGPYWPLNTTLYVRDFHGNSERFIYYLLSQLKLERFAASTGVPSLNRNFVHPEPVPLPPLPEQRAIAAVLDSIDDAIERTEAVITATERLRDALLHELLTRGVPGWHTEWKSVPGVGTIPACWNVVWLEDVSEVQTGRAVNRKALQNGSLEVPYLSVANVKDGYLDLGVVKTMLVAPFEINRYRLQNGDVLFTEGGDADKLGRGTVWRNEIDLCLHQNHIFAVRPCQSTLYAEFLAVFAASSRGKQYFLGAAKQTTNLASMNATQLRQMPLPLPSLQEQRAIVSVLDSVSGAIQRTRGERDGLQSLKASAADALLSGRVRVG